MNKGILLLALCAVVTLGYLTVMSVVTPVRFDQQQKARELALQKQLKTIATLEDAFEDVYGRFATEEELKAFVETGKIYYVNAEGIYTDAMRESGLTEAEAARKGLIKRDTIWKSAKDSLLKDGTDFATLIRVNADRNIQIETGVIEQEVGTDTIQQSVFRAIIPFESYLSDLNPTRLQEKIEAAKARNNAYPGLVIGSLTEVKMTGNWE